MVHPMTLAASRATQSVTRKTSPGIEIPIILLLERERIHIIPLGIAVSGKSQKGMQRVLLCIIQIFNKANIN